MNGGTRWASWEMAARRPRPGRLRPTSAPRRARLACPAGVARASGRSPPSPSQSSSAGCPPRKSCGGGSLTTSTGSRPPPSQTGRPLHASEHARRPPLRTCQGGWVVSKQKLTSTEARTLQLAGRGSLCAPALVHAHRDMLSVGVISPLLELTERVHRPRGRASALLCPAGRSLALWRRRLRQA